MSNHQSLCGYGDYARGALSEVQTPDIHAVLELSSIDEGNPNFFGVDELADEAAREIKQQRQHSKTIQGGDPS